MPTKIASTHRSWQSTLQATLTSLYAAAMADRTEAEGAPVYCQWVSWLWSGDVLQVIAALAKRQAEVGLPTDDDPTSVRRIVSGALTYLQL